MSDLLFFFFLSDRNIRYCFLYFLATLIAASFHVQMLLKYSNSLCWISEWYLSFLPSSNWDSASQIEIMKQCIPQNNLFQQMTMLQYWAYWPILILTQFHHTWHRYIFNMAKLYPFFSLTYLNSDVFSALHNEHLRLMEI